jgi:hypothetical protein
MHDSKFEERLRTVLRAEGDGLPMTITAAELQRRLAVRQRQHRGRTLTLIAAVIAVVAVGAVAATANGWLRMPAVGASQSPSPSPTETPRVSVGPSATPAAAATEPPPSCTTVDPSTMTDGIDIALESSSDPQRLYVGNASVYRMGDTISGTAGSFADADALNEPMMVASPASELLVSGASYAACITSLEADAVPFGQLAGDPLPLAPGFAMPPTDTATFSPPPTGSWVVRIAVGFETTNGDAWSQAFFNVDVGGPPDTPEPTEGLPPTSVPR